ncbi:MAG TPA: isoprenylcysteine carboxylmethyltransferase family protein [Candidatus Paceibacterota bacterium]|nr:isoprenylcysteine carboxylmethyltransferase family protein [Candidatus Paceibacterota bacterium]
MSFSLWVMLACWLIFFAYWIVSAFSTKRTVRSEALWIGVLVRLAIFIFIVVLLLLSNEHLIAIHNVITLPSSQLFDTIGALLCIGGLSLALWARTIIGRNWGMPMTIKEDRELVTSGPYAAIRHPIYAALLLMILGSACIEGIVWLILFCIFFIYFIGAASSEEQSLAQEFPEQYPAYMARTKMVVPGFL